MKNNGFKILSLAAISIGLFGIGAAAYAQAQAANRPLPGRWEFKTVAAGIYNDSDDYCLSQAEIDRFYNNPCKRNSVCVYSVKKFNPDGSATFKGTWTDRKKRVTKLNVNGVFQPAKLTLKGTASIYNVPVPINFTATRIAATCKK